VIPPVKLSDLTRIVVAVDPAATAEEDSDDTGIVVVARGPHQPATCKLDVHCPGHGYVLADRTCHLLPVGWAREAIRAYHDFGADRVVAETNNGGDMVGTVIHAIEVVPYAKVTATRGKVLRAEPASALYEQGRVHHLGDLALLEDEQYRWTPESKWSPNRVDALVWGLTYLGLVGDTGSAFMTAWKNEIQDRKPEQVPSELNSLPQLGANLPSLLKPGCKHRFFTDGLCVFCGGLDPRASLDNERECNAAS
jgi:phage terminase large subunit-like protein